MALWWAWASYAWLTNWLNPEEGAVRLAMFGSMAAMLIISLAVPHAFGVDGVHLRRGVFHRARARPRPVRDPGRGDRELFGAILRITPGAVMGPALILWRDSPTGRPARDLGRRAVDRLPLGPHRRRAWLARLTGALRRAPRADRGHRPWRVDRRDRCRRGGRRARAATITAALLGVVVAAALWWSYFDWVVYISQARLPKRLARNGPCSRATSIPTCTCRWWRGSSCSRSA